jgi:hypothetical protein
VFETGCGSVEVEGTILGTLEATRNVIFIRVEGATTTYVNFKIASSLPELGTRWANRMAIWTPWLLIGSAVRFHRQLGSEMRPYGGHKQ